MPRRLRGGHPVGGEDAVVAKGGVAAAEVEAAEERERVAVEAVVVVDDRAALRARVLQVRSHQRVTRRDVVRELGRAEVLADAELFLVVENDGAVVVHAVPCAEEPQFVLDHEAAEVDTVVLLGESRRRAAGGADVLRVGLQRVGLVIREPVAAELVAAGLGDDVDDPAGGAAELGLVAAGLDLHFLDELEVEVLALEAVLDAGGVHAVDVEGVLRAGRAVDADGVRRGRIGVGVRGDARHDLRDRRVAAAGWKVVDGERGEVGPERR